LKQCFECLETLQLEEFYRHKGMADGHLNKCKKCVKKGVLEHRNRNIEKIRAYDKQRSKTPERMYRNKVRSSVWRRENNGKYKAHYLLNNAVRDGRIKREPCEICGYEKSHGHHEDYSKPLDVVWLCAVHHSAAHK